MSGMLFTKAKDVVSAIFIVLLWTSLGGATTYYADNSATGCENPVDYNYNPSTRACGSGSYSVYSTIQGAADVVVAGDTVLVQPGTYNEKVISSANGTSGSRITFEANGTVVMKGFKIYGNYITLDGFRIENISTTFPGAIEIAGSSNHGVLQNFTATNFNSRKRFVWMASGTSNWLFTDNRIYDLQTTLECPSGCNMVFWLDGSNHTVEKNDIGPHYHDVFVISGTEHIIRDNYIHDLEVIDSDHVDVIQCYPITGSSGTTNNWVFERNKIINSWTPGQNLQPFTFNYFEPATGSGNVTIRNNLFINFGWHINIRIPNVKIYNNTFNRLYTIYTYTGGSAEVKNNIIYNPVSSTNLFHVSGGGPLNHDYNLVYPYVSDGNETNGINGSAPGFVSVATNDYHILPDSPARDAGATLSGFTDDKDGIVRRQGAWDIGAYEVRDFISAPSEPVAPLCASEEIIEAESGTLVFPMESVSDASLSGGAYIRTTDIDSGKATYTLNVAETGDYEIRTYAHSANAGANSFYFSLDGLSEDTWDMFYEGTSFGGWAEDYMSRRGAGTVDNPEADPYVITLTAGTHTLNLRGREIDARLDYFCLVKKQTQTTTPVAPAPPTGLRIVQVQ